MTDSEASRDSTAVSAPTPTPHIPSIAAAIARFKPTPREVISGIAPHVFDERRRRRRRSQSSRPHPYGSQRGGAKSSPLRISAVIGWDEETNVIYLEPAEHGMEPAELFQHPVHDLRQFPHEPQQKGKKDKHRWRGFRIFKTIIIKFKSSN